MNREYPTATDECIICLESEADPRGCPPTPLAVCLANSTDGACKCRLNAHPTCLHSWLETRRACPGCDIGIRNWHMSVRTQEHEKPIVVDVREPLYMEAWGQEQADSSGRTSLFASCALMACLVILIVLLTAR